MTGTCTVTDCPKPLLSRGYCCMHYARFMKYGSTDLPESIPVNTVCTEDNCITPAYARQLCQKHYDSKRNHGGIIIKTQEPHPTTCGVEGCQRPYVCKGFCHLHARRMLKYGSTDKPERTRVIPKNKRYKGEGGKMRYRHIVEARLGRSLNKGEVVHHIDGNSLNNDPSNLEVMLHADHIRHHIWAKYGNTATHKHCARCKQLFPRTIIKDGGYCNSCAQDYVKQKRGEGG